MPAAITTTPAPATDATVEPRWPKLAAWAATVSEKLCAWSLPSGVKTLAARPVALVPSAPIFSPRLVFPNALGAVGGRAALTSSRVAPS